MKNRVTVAALGGFMIGLGLPIIFFGGLGVVVGGVLCVGGVILLLATLSGLRG